MEVSTTCYINIVSPRILHSDFIDKTRIVLNLSDSSAYFQFELAKFFPRSTIIMEDLFWQMGEAHDSSLLECQLGNLSDEQLKDTHELVSRHVYVLTSGLRLTQLLEN